MTASSSNLDQLVLMSEDQLFNLLAPPRRSGELGAPGSSIARGKEIFRAVLNQSRSAICTSYHQNKDAVNGTADIGSLVLAAMTSSVTIAGVPLAPAVALVLKTGLAVICPARNQP